MRSARDGKVTVHVDAPPDKVWSVVANVDRMGEWSPECYRVEWLDGATSPARPGARFKGWNKWGPVRWSMTCRVRAADPGREVSWSTLKGDRELVTWAYRMEPSGEGTDVTESFEVHHMPLSAVIFEDFVMVNRDQGRERAMRQTLDRIKAVAESA